MIRLYDLDKRFADIELIDGRMIIRNIVGDKESVIEGIEFVRRGRSDTELFHALPHIFCGQCWAGYKIVDDQPGPDDEVFDGFSEKIVEIRGVSSGINDDVRFHDEKRKGVHVATLDYVKETPRYRVGVSEDGKNKWFDMSIYYTKVSYGKLIVHELKPLAEQTEAVMHAWNADDEPGPDDEIFEPECERHGDAKGR